MKKRHLFYTLLLSMLGAQGADAKVNLGNNVTDPGKLKAGDKIIVRANGGNEVNGSMQYSFLSALADSMVYTKTGMEAMDPYVLLELEASDVKIAGKTTFYLKNRYNNKYVSYTWVKPSVGEDGEEENPNYDGEGYLLLDLKYADKAQACPFLITTQKEGAELTEYDGDAPEDENCMMLITQCKEEKNTLVSLNYNGNPFVSTYSDGPSWYQVYQGTYEEDYISDLTVLYTKTMELKYVAGTDPGCYSKELVDAFNKANEDAGNAINNINPTEEECKTAFLTLEKAYLNIQLASAVGITEGYYRIVNAFAGFKEQQGKEKAAYANNKDAHAYWKDLDEKDATQVWKLTKRTSDGSWFMYNVGTGQYISGTQGKQYQSPWYALSNDTTNTKQMEFVSLGQANFNPKFNGSNSFHTANHGGGANANGPLVAYNGGIGSQSAWFVRKVSDDQIPEFEAIGEQNKLNRELEALYSQANEKYKIGEAYKPDTDTTKWLVRYEDWKKDPKVILSNASHNDWHKDDPDGGGLDALVDSLKDTYWQSCWKTPAPAEKHYLQFKLNKKAKCISLLLERRLNQPNQATKLDVYVTNGDTAQAESWSYAGNISGMPATTVGVSEPKYQTSGVTFDKEYEYVRFYITSNSGDVNGQKFTSFAGFHIQPATLDENCQNAQLGKVAEELQAALFQAYKEIEAQKATQATIDLLQEKFEAYMGELADPTELKAKLDSIKNIMPLAATPSMKAHDNTTVVFKEGYPGVYTDAAKTAMQTILDEVQKYIDENDAKGTYTKDGITAQIKKLDEGLAAMKASQGKIKAADETEDGIWYYINASKNHFDVTGDAQDTYGEGENLQVRNGHLYVDVKNVTDDVLNDATLRVTGNKDIEKDLGLTTDHAKWRFVNMGDTAYAVQNKATGLYLGQKTGGGAGLSITPSAVKPEEIGHATFLLTPYNYKDAKKISQFHIQTNGQLFVLWDNRDLGDGSCFDIKPTTDNGEPAVDVNSSQINLRTVVKGKLYTMCYPVGVDYVADEVNETASAYTIASIDNEKKELTLAPTDGSEVPGGTPFFYIAGGTELGVAEEPTAADTIKFQTTLASNTKEIVRTPLTVNGLIGNYYGNTKIEKGFGFVTEEKGKQMIAPAGSNQTIGWNSAYIDAAQITNGEPGEIVVPLKGELSTAIEDAIKDAIIGNVDVYTIDGILVKKNVKASEATEGLVKGIYIIGNKKVAIQ